MSKPEERDNTDGRKVAGRLEGLMNGFNELLERLNRLSEQGEKTVTGTLGSSPGQGEGEGGRGSRRPRGVFGLSVKVGGLGGDTNDMKVEPFGNVRRDHETGGPVVEDVREPLVDVFDEQSRVLVVAEMPGIDASDVRATVQDNALDLSAEHGVNKYKKRIPVPANIQADTLQVTGQNGIVEISCTKR